MENFSRRNSGALSHIQFKLDTLIEHQCGITCHESRLQGQIVKRQDHKVT